MIENRTSEDNGRLQLLREAASVGITDIEAGCFRAFDSIERLNQHFGTVATEATQLQSCFGELQMPVVPQ